MPDTTTPVTDERIEEIAEAVERALIPGSKPWRIAFARALLVAQQPTPAQGGEPSGDEALMRQALSDMQRARAYILDDIGAGNVLDDGIEKLRSRLEGTKP
jgi:hypothetical protein